MGRLGASCFGESTELCCRVKVAKMAAADQLQKGWSHPGLRDGCWAHIFADLSSERRMRVLGDG